MTQLQPLHRRRLASIRHRVRSARQVRATTRALTPPPPWAYATFGERSIVVPPARIENPHQISIGDGVLIHEHAWLLVRGGSDDNRPTLTLGDRAVLGRFAKVVAFRSVVIGQGAVLADRVYLSDVEYEPGHLDTLPDRRMLTDPRPVVIGGGSFVGIGAIIKPGVTIGERAYIGAGSIVTKDVPPESLAVGQPARVVRRYDPSAGVWSAVTDGAPPKI